MTARRWMAWWDKLQVSPHPRLTEGLAQKDADKWNRHLAKRPTKLGSEILRGERVVHYWWSDYDGPKRLCDGHVKGKRRFWMPPDKHYTFCPDCTEILIDSYRRRDGRLTVVMGDSWRRQRPYELAKVILVKEVDDGNAKV